MLPSQSSDQILETAARDGTIDIAEWPRVLETVLQRLHDIVHNDFPLPSLPLLEPGPPSIDPEVVVSSTPPPIWTSDTDVRDDTLPDADDSELPPPNSQSSTKENDAPPSLGPQRPPVPAFSSSPHPTTLPAPSEIEPQSGTLPPDLLSLYTVSTHILETEFARSPPYTIQRLAELVVYPRKHYRFLPAYLRALNRTVSVNSPLDHFPLPTLHAPSTGGFLTNGDGPALNGISEREGLGSDESLGGALLTPIPWLRNSNSLASSAASAPQSDGELHSESTETIEGPNGAGSIETVTVTVNGVPSASSASHTSPAPVSPTLSEQSDASSSSSSGGTTDQQLREQGAVTQGELLRQEQEAGVIPIAQTSPRRSLLAGGAVAVGREPANGGLLGAVPDVLDDVPDELPHARGPEEIGMEDMGPQHHHSEGGLDLEAAVGRGRSKSPQPPAAVSPEPAPMAEAEAEMAEQDSAGGPGKDPADVEKEVEKLKEAMDEEEEREAKDADGDVVIADADGRPVDERDKQEITGDLGGADAVDTTTL